MKKIIIVVAILVGGYFFWQQKFNDNNIGALDKNGSQRVDSASNVSKLSVGSKIKLYDKYQKEIESKANDLLKKMANDNLTPDEVMKYRAQLSNLGGESNEKRNSF